MSKLKLGLIFGGQSQEHEISIMSARSIDRAINKEKYEVIPFAISPSGYWLGPKASQKVLAGNKSKVKYKGDSNRAGSLKSFLNENLDVVFPILHGPYGEDGRIQGMLEMLGLPYVGPGVLSSAVGMDKAVMKQLCARQNIPQPRFLILRKMEYEEQSDKMLEKISRKIGYPLFVKPANLGSSIGISKVFDSDKLKKALTAAWDFDSKLIIEEAVAGRELECSVLGNEEVQASNVGEIKPGHEFYDYQAKYEDDSTELIIPAELSRDIRETIQRLAVDVFKIIEGKGLARVDFFLRKKDKRVLVNEVNTIPGFTKYSMYPKLWEVSGIAYSQLIDYLIQLALKK